MFSVYFCFVDNNPTYGERLMLKDKCDGGIFEHRRSAVNTLVDCVSFKLQLNVNPNVYIIKI